jgi:hypothetical protein
MTETNFGWTIDTTPTLNNIINIMNDAMDIEDNTMINMLSTNMAYVVNNEEEEYIINDMTVNEENMNFNEENMNYIQDSSTAPGNWYYNYSLFHNNNYNNMELETPDFVPFETGAIPFETGAIPFVTERIHIATVLEQFIVSQEDRYCCVCMETNMSQTDICKLNCGHKYCNNCMIQHINAHKNASVCPLCRVKISTVTVNSNDGLILFTFA